MTQPQPSLEDLEAEVPADLRSRFREIVRLTDQFADDHLNAEYEELCRDMAVVLCHTDSPATRGKAESWAAGIVYTVGWVNFLTDPSQTPHMKADDIAKAIGVSAATMQSKSRVLREGLDLMRLDPNWTLPSRVDDNPMIWILKVNGLLMDIRDAPRGAQEQAYRQGLIPYIPADREDAS